MKLASSYNIFYNKHSHFSLHEIIFWDFRKIISKMTTSMFIACACTNLDISWIYLHTHKKKSLKMLVRCCKHVTRSLKIFQRTFFFRGHLRNPNDPLLTPWRFFNLLWHLSGLCLEWGWRDSEMVSSYSQPEWNVTANTQTFAFDLHKGTAGVFSRERPHWIHNELLQHSFNSSLNFTPPQPRISCVTLMNVEKHISQFPKGHIENMRTWGPDCCRVKKTKANFLSDRGVCG